MESIRKGGAREALKRIQGADKVKGQRSNHKHKIQRTIDDDVIDIENTHQRTFDDVCASVVIMCMSSLLIGGEDQGELLLEALEMGMVSKGYVFIPYDALLYAMPYQVTN